LPRGPQAIVAAGRSGTVGALPQGFGRDRLPAGWSLLPGEAAFMAAACPLDRLPADPDALASALAGWTLARLEELKGVLPDLAGGMGAPG
jgi:hypothetical protein